MDISIITEYVRVTGHRFSKNPQAISKIYVPKN